MERLFLVSHIGLWVVVILQTLLILALFRYLGLLLNRLPAQGPPLGKAAPRRDVADLNGRTHALGAPATRGQVLIFTSPTCPWCEKLAPDIPPFAASLGGEHDLLLVLSESTADPDARAYAEKVGGGMRLDVCRHSELFESYAVPGTPYGLFIDPEGIVRAKGTANTLTDLQTLVRVRA